MIAVSALLSTSPTAVVTAPSSGATRKFQVAPHWHDLVLFYEYFHGDNCVEIGPTSPTIRPTGQGSSSNLTLVRDHHQVIEAQTGNSADCGNGIVLVG